MTPQTLYEFLSANFQTVYSMRPGTIAVVFKTDDGKLFTVKDSYFIGQSLILSGEKADKPLPEEGVKQVPSVQNAPELKQILDIVTRIEKRQMAAAHPDRLSSDYTRIMDEHGIL